MKRNVMISFHRIDLKKGKKRIDTLNSPFISRDESFNINIYQTCDITRHGYTGSPDIFDEPNYKSCTIEWRLIIAFFILFFFLSNQEIEKFIERMGSRLEKFFHSIHSAFDSLFRRRNIYNRSRDVFPIIGSRFELTRIL